MSCDTYFTPSKLSLETGFPAHFIREACHRGEKFHPLPHVKSGKKRPTLRISINDWNSWLDEEKHLKRR